MAAGNPGYAARFVSIHVFLSVVRMGIHLLYRGRVC